MKKDSWKTILQIAITDRYRYYARSNELHGIKNMESTLL